MMNPTTNQLQTHIIEEDDTVDLAKYLGFFFDNRWLIAGVAFVVMLLGLAYVLVATPIYKANMLVKVESDSARPKSMPVELAGSETNHDTKAAVAAEMEVLRSRAVITRAVDSGRFYISVKPKYFPLIGEWIARRSKQISEPGLFGLGGYVWGSEQAKVSEFNVPEELEGKPFILTANGSGGYRLTQDEYGIDVAGKAGDTLTNKTGQGVLELRVDQLNAKAGAQFTLSRAGRLETVERLQEGLNIGEKGKQSGIIDVALEGPNPKLISTILNEIGREYVALNIDKKAEEAKKTLTFLNTQLPELKKELEQSETKYNQLRNSRGTVDLGEEAKSALSQSVMTQTKLLELKQKKDDLLTRYQPNHPSVLALDQQMDGLRREIAGIEARIKKLPDVEQNVLRLNRDVKINTDLYTALLSAAQQLRVATESNVGSVRVLDTAVVPLRPIKPKRSLVLVLTGMVGIVLGIMAALARKSIYGRIDGPREIEERLGLPVTATIPHSASQDKVHARLQHDKQGAAVLPLDVPYDGTIESLRRFRTSLQFAMLEAKNNIVMIAGATPSVGKSFVSANFAAVLASIGKKVLLIDGDMRSGHLHRYFGMERSPGLSEVITGEAMYGKAIRRDVAENVDFLSSGQIPRKPTELLAHDNFGKLLELFSARYDYILIDTPPLLAVSDALVVASHAGAIFNVVRGGQTTTGEIEETVRRLNQAGHKVTGVVFNDSKQRFSRYGYDAAYGKYGYVASEGKA
ncbi:polysaccharide biosynthesis tyrosine autokinase [Noviherbaspirillum denitrificans]|uniref:Putative tyrosine-protein kinase EpsB n=1 Tax=Noviherbaspirillum denitrificans TaxID=1968433 RepID=A0A254T7M7_9BURK|nr:polysaccharide biosynthesis tyrosine autokinase [Noviherbaspirillum denitrificans]OWW18575.1 hypothetical protein AYR66_00760 [Noviherbaspirillum denitrificans]